MKGKVWLCINFDPLAYYYIIFNQTLNVSVQNTKYMYTFYGRTVRHLITKTKNVITYSFFKLSALNTVFASYL